jgi:hypothetical protein
MTNTLLTAGLVCIIAAVIGGGLKAFGIEIPALQSTTRQILLGTLGLILLLGTYASYTQFARPPITPPDGELNHPSPELNPIKGSSTGADVDSVEQLAMTAKQAADRAEGILQNGGDDVVAVSQAAADARVAADRARVISNKIEKSDGRSANAQIADQVATGAEESANRAEDAANRIKEQTRLRRGEVE